MVREINSLGLSMAEASAYHAEHRELVDWRDHRLKKVTRLRLLTDPGYGYLDVSYCYGVLYDGTKVRVQVGFSHLARRCWKTEIVRAAQRDGVHAKRLGIFAAVSILY